MAPIPPKPKKQTRQAGPVYVSTDNVIDDLGRNLTSLNQRQSRINKDQEKNTTIARQHASQYESDMQNSKLVYRDVFPARKYVLTLSDTRWIAEGNKVQIGYTVDDEFTQIGSDITEPPEENKVEFTLPVVAAVDTVEVRLVGAEEKVRGYLEDTSTAGSVSQALEKLVEWIMGDDGINARVTELERQVADLEERVKALEDK
jgi:chaperonin cofactor prefoldin